MMVKFDEVLEDWREDVCARCGNECNPRYRFCYSTKKTNTQNMPLTEFEIQVCRKCCFSLERDWKMKCKNVSPYCTLIKKGRGNNK